MEHANKLVELFKAKNGVVIDDHKLNNETRKFKGVVVFQRGDHTFACPAIPGTHFCINDLYEKDGDVHLSKWSVGGLVEPVHAASGDYRDITVDDLMSNYRGEGKIVAVHWL